MVQRMSPQHRIPLLFLIINPKINNSILKRLVERLSSLCSNSQHQLVQLIEIVNLKINKEREVN
jgi:hypothetical protein